MTAVSLNEVLPQALENGYAIPGFVVHGWEDASAYVEAAEDLNCPIILQAGPACRMHTPVSILGRMFRYLADQSKVKIVCHIDHALSAEECIEGINEGFTSVMFDGSKLTLDENIEKTIEIKKIAKNYNVSLEGEIGFVGYNKKEKSVNTDPSIAEKYFRKTNVDALAVSVGNIHLNTSLSNKINLKLIHLIQQKVSCPLVIHGSSGIDCHIRKKLSSSTSICKFNIGTELRKTFGQEIRKILSKNKSEFDRIKSCQRSNLN